MRQAPCLGGLAHRGDDVGVGAAAADVAAHLFADFVVRAGAALLDGADRRHDLAGRAVAALEGIVLDERRLHRMQAAIVGQALDRGDRLALAHHRQRQAGHDAPAIQQDGAGAALAEAAALLGAGQVQPVAQRVEQRGARIDLHIAWLVVDGDRDSEAVRRVLHEIGSLAGGGQVGWLNGAATRKPGKAFAACDHDP